MDSTAALSEMLLNVGYKPVQLDDILSEGLPNAQFRHIVRWLTDEIRVLGSLDECVSGGCCADGDDDDDDANNLSVFVMELSSFLTELQCPLETCYSGPAAERFQSVATCTGLLNYLMAELMALKMEHQQRQQRAADMVIELTESAAASALTSILAHLNLDKPAANVTASELFGVINKQVAATIPQADPKRLGPPLFTPSRPLSDAQWQTVEQFHRDLNAEYNLRRDMLITRLDVTVQSFQWSSKHSRELRDTIADRYAARRQLMDATMLRGGALSTGVPALLAAREDLAIVEKTVSAATRTTADVQKHLMGSVPDRGGRTENTVAPPPEMPSWSKRTTDGGGGGGGRGGRGGRGGHGGGGGPQPQRVQPQGGGFPAATSGYQQSMGYGGGQHHGGHRGGRGGSFNGGGGGGRGGGSGRVQGGWSQAGVNHHRGGHHHQQGGGGYQQHQGNNGGGGYQQHQGNNGGGGFQQHQGNNGGGGYHRQQQGGNNGGGYQQHNQGNGGGGYQQRQGDVGGNNNAEYSFANGYQHGDENHRRGGGRGGHQSNYRRGGGGGRG